MAEALIPIHYDPDDEPEEEEEEEPSATIDATPHTHSGNRTTSSSSVHDRSGANNSTAALFENDSTDEDALSLAASAQDARAAVAVAALSLDSPGASQAVCDAGDHDALSRLSGSAHSTQLRQRTSPTTGANPPTSTRGAKKSKAQQSGKAKSKERTEPSLLSRGRKGDSHSGIRSKSAHAQKTSRSSRSGSSSDDVSSAGVTADHDHSAASGSETEEDDNEFILV